MPGIGYGSGYLFPYPDGELTNLQYLLHIPYASTNGGRDVLKNRKHVWIEVRDRNNRVLLHEEAFFDCASIEASRTWQDFSKLHVTLSEVGNEFTAVDDPYNAALIKSGPKLLLDREYEYNPRTKLFERVR